MVVKGQTAVAGILATVVVEEGEEEALKEQLTELDEGHGQLLPVHELETTLLANASLEFAEAVALPPLAAVCRRNSMSLPDAMKKEPPAWYQREKVAVRSAHSPY